MNRLRERRKRPWDPGEYLAGTLAIAVILGFMAIFLVLYSAFNAFRIGFREAQAARVLLAFFLALPIGVFVAYVLLRPLLPTMARGRPIPGNRLFLRGLMDLFASGLALGAFFLTTQFMFGGSYQVRMLQDLAEVVFAVFVGYLLGANAVRAAIGWSWARSRRLAVSAGRAPMAR
jgi:hypothetical protein